MTAPVMPTPEADPFATLPPPPTSIAIEADPTPVLGTEVGEFTPGVHEEGRVVFAGLRKVIAGFRAGMHESLAESAQADLVSHQEVGEAAAHRRMTAFHLAPNNGRRQKHSKNVGEVRKEIAELRSAQYRLYRQYSLDDEDTRQQRGVSSTNRRVYPHPSSSDTDPRIMRDMRGNPPEGSDLSPLPTGDQPIIPGFRRSWWDKNWNYRRANKRFTKNGKEITELKEFLEQVAEGTNERVPGKLPGTTKIKSGEKITARVEKHTNKAHKLRERQDRLANARHRSDTVPAAEEERVRGARRRGRKVPLPTVPEIDLWDDDDEEL